MKVISYMYINILEVNKSCTITIIVQSTSITSILLTSFMDALGWSSTTFRQFDGEERRLVKGEFTGSAKRANKCTSE